MGTEKLAGMGTEKPSSMAALENKLNEKIQDIHEELNIRIRKSDGLLSFLKQAIEKLLLKAKVRSRGNSRECWEQFVFPRNS